LTRREERVARAEIRKMLENSWGAIQGNVMIT
jgi:hypothetical protein